MKRREFITLLGGAVAGWPLPARAQQGDRMRRIGGLNGGDENDPVMKTRLSAFMQVLTELGWTDGFDVRIDFRWGCGDNNRIRALARELVEQQPDIILAGGAAATVARQRDTPKVPPVFVNVRGPRGWTGRAGTSPDSPSSKPRWQASGLSCSRRSRRGSSGSQSCSIPTPLPYRLICPHLRRRPGHSRSRQSLRPFIATQKSKRP